MVGRERLWPNADVDSTIAAAADLVGSVIAGQELKGIDDAEPNLGDRAVMRMTRQEFLEQRHRRRRLWLGGPKLRDRASAHCGDDGVPGEGLEGFIEMGLGTPGWRALTSVHNRVTT